MRYRKVSIVEAIQYFGVAYEIETKQGLQWVYDTDWLITNPNGEVYPCNDRTFKHTYEVVG